MSKQIDRFIGDEVARIEGLKTLQSDTGSTKKSTNLPRTSVSEHPMHKFC